MEIEGNVSCEPVNCKNEMKNLSIFMSYSLAEKNG